MLHILQPLACIVTPVTVCVFARARSLVILPAADVEAAIGRGDSSIACAGIVDEVAFIYGALRPNLRAAALSSARSDRPFALVVRLVEPDLHLRTSFHLAHKFFSLIVVEYERAQLFHQIVVQSRWRKSRRGLVTWSLSWSQHLTINHDA